MSNRTQLMRAFSSLAPISEVYSSESMHIGNKIDYTGLIKRDAGLLTVWSARNFTLRIGDSQKAQLVILKNQTAIEEVVFLNQLKITKKCTIMDDKPCFGIVMGEKKKYLISLKNIHECQKFHAELSHVKKAEKQLVQLYYSKRQHSVSNIQKNQQKEKIKRQPNQIIQTNQESDEMSQSEESERIHRRYRNRQLGLDSMDSNQDNIFQSNFREASTSVPIENEDSVLEQMQKFFDINQNSLLSSHFGFTPYPGFQRQKIFINKQNFTKSTFVLKTSASIHSCIKLFLSFSVWNQNVKKSHNLSTTQNGPIMYLQFVKGLTASQPRCVIGEVNLLQDDYGAALRVKSVKRANYEYLSQKREVKMELFAKMVTDRSNKLQKVMTVALRIQPSKEEFELAAKFLRAIKDYQQQCNKLI